LTVNDGPAVKSPPGWAEILRQDFPDSQVGRRPQVWCGGCREAGKFPSQKFCGKKKDEQGSGGVDHVMAKCGECGQKVSKAHMHLTYVGHAHMTSRLLEADPEWTWRPARDIPAEVLIAAISTCDLAIVQAVLSAYPPKITELQISNGNVERVMWGELIIHDENGREIITPGVGDAIGKSWGPNAVKEMIGDLVRNAAMRRGGALKLWMKEDEERATHERRGGSADDASGFAARSAIFDDDAKPAGRTRKPAAAKNETPAVDAGINPEAQAAADLAYQLATSPGGTLATLQAEWDKVRARKHSGLHVIHPWERAMKTKIMLHKVYARAREELEAKAKAEATAKAEQKQQG
jgi:hypothetical protein